MKQGNKTFSGRAALIWLLLFFGVVAMVNGVMIGFAIYSNPERRASVTSNQVSMTTPTVLTAVPVRNSGQ